MGGDHDDNTSTENSKQNSVVQKMLVEDYNFRLQNNREALGEPDRSWMTLALFGKPFENGRDAPIDPSDTTKVYVTLVPANKVGPPTYKTEKGAGTIRMYADIAYAEALESILKQDPLYVIYSEDAAGKHDAVLSHTPNF